MTTVVARVCFDALKRRETRREDLMPDDPRRELVAMAPGERPEEEAVLADSVGVALLILLDSLGPAERVAFVLHDMFDVPFDDIAGIVGRTPDAARQLASRARRRVRGASPPRDSATRRHDELVRAFFAASRSGNFSALLSLLDPNATLRADAHVVEIGAAPLTHGADEIAKTFVERWQGARAAFPALIDDEPAAVWLHKERPVVLFRFKTVGVRITGIDLVGDPATLERAVVETS
jgi:RNA polymerase sigma-70 factor (ECF subfamily)